MVIFRAHYAVHATDVTRPFPGIVDALDALAARGFVLAVLTNKHGEAARLILDRLGLAHRFALILGGGDVSALKPDPAGLLDCLARLGVASAHAWYVGDLALDVDTARRAGVPAAGASWGYGDRGALEAARPQMMLVSVSDLGTLG